MNVEFIALSAFFMNLIEFAAIVWLLIHLRHSAAPYQAALISDLRRDVDHVTNVQRVASRDMLEDRRTRLAADTQIHEELRQIRVRLDEMRCPLGDPMCPLSRQG